MKNEAPGNKGIGLTEKLQAVRVDVKREDQDLD